MNAPRSAVAATLLGMASVHAAAQPPAANITAAPAFTARELAAAPRTDWPTNGGDLANHRYSPLTEINRETVTGLKAVWRASLRGSGLDRRDSGQAQVLEHDGTLYTITGNDDVFAISVATGEVLWEYTAQLDAAQVAVCCGWVSRGVGIGDGRVYVAQLDNRLVALDQKSGKVVWSVQSQTLKDGGYSFTAAPLYYDGLVIIGHAGGDMGMRGCLKAFDARTGKLRWIFYTVPAPGEPGHDSWPAGSDVWKYGGGSIWQTPAVDPQLGLLFVSTDNPAPDLNGSVRAGDNLFTDSVVALDVHTGKYRWHFQEVHHDIWDYGAPNPVVLFDVMIDGRPRKALAQLSKDGYAYLLDRQTGKPLLGIEEQPVMQSRSQATAPTQPIPQGDDIVPHLIDAAPDGIELVNQGRTFTPFEEVPVAYKPLAGVNWPPSSYDADSHLLFVCANDSVGLLTRGGEKFEPPPIGEHYTGGVFGRTDLPRRGILAALDVTSNRLAWRRQWGDGCSGGSVNTAGGLLFIGRSDGRLVAYDKRDGRLVWSFQTDAPVAAPPTVFEYRGTEYVAVMAAGTLYSSGKRGDGLWLFSLRGTLAPQPPLTAEAAAAGVGAGTEDSVLAAPVNAVRGKKIYTANCEPCHGSNGQGNHGQGVPFKPPLTAASVVTVATAGRKDMPSFRSALTLAELRDVAAYISEQLIK